MQMSDLATQLVARSAALLDEKVQDWYDHVDCEKLDISHPDRCVLGQVFGEHEPPGWALIPISGYAIGMEYLFANERPFTFTGERYAFNVPGVGIRGSASYTQAKLAVENAWRDAIEQRIRYPEHFLPTSHSKL